MHREQAVIDAPPAPVWDGKLQPNTIQQAEISTLIDRLPAESVDLVFTDPPYHEEHLPLYGQLADIALHALKARRVLFCLCGPAVSRSDHHLNEFIPGLPVDHCSGDAVREPCSQPARRLLKMAAGCCVPQARIRHQANRTGAGLHPHHKAKAYHEWQQDTECPTEIIEHFCPVGGVVLEPFVGGGTTPFVARQLKRNFIAFDKDPFAVSISTQRLSDAEVNG